MKNLKGTDVLFISPPVLRFCKQKSYSFPLGLGYMVSYLEQLGIKARIYNADIYEGGTANLNSEKAELWENFLAACSDRDHPVWKEIENVLLEIKPKIVGVSSKAVDIPSTLKIAEISKRVSPETVVVLGGTSATISWEYVLGKSRYFDFLVIGEAEQTILDLTRWILNGKDPEKLPGINGLVYRDESDQIIKNQPRDLFKDLDRLPFPDRESMFRVKTDGSYEQILATGDILASRGCPYLCRFCSAFATWGTRKPRFRSIDNIIDEIVMLKEKYKQKFFIFWDDLFTANKKRVNEFCHRLLDMDLNIEWLCLVRINNLDADLLDLMKRAGCCEIQIGIESGSDRILRLIKKDIKMEQILSKAPIIKASGIRWSIFLVIGFPGESKAEIISTMNLINKLMPDRVELRLFTPYPGTDFFNELKEAGKIGEDFFKFDVFNPRNNFTDTMDDNEYRELAMKALQCADRYNASPRIELDLSYLDPPEDPVVSVVLGTYNRIEYLQFTVESIRKAIQGIRSEIIIVDGGSTDGTMEWLMSQKDIITIVQHNRGEWIGKSIRRRSWGYFMNLGFRCAAGKYVCMLSDDCVLLPGAIEKGVESFEKAVSEGKKVGAAAFYWKDWPSHNYYEVQVTLDEKMYVNHGLFLKEAMQEVGFAEEKLYMFYFADCDFCLKMAEAGYQCIEASDSYVIHYTHANDDLRNSNAVYYKSEFRAFKNRWEGIFYDSQKDNYIQDRRRKKFNDIEYMTELQSGNSPFKYKEKENSRIRTVDELIKRECNRGSIAIYGAGEHTENLMDRTSMDEMDVQYIVDRNDCINNLFGIPVLKPSEISKNPPDIVVISSFKFQNEMVEYLRESLGFKGKVIRLYGSEDNRAFYC